MKRALKSVPPCGVKENSFETWEYDAVMKRLEEKTCESSPFQTRDGPSWFQEAGGGRSGLTPRPALILLPSVKVPASAVESKSWAFNLPLTSFRVVLSGFPLT